LLPLELPIIPDHNFKQLVIVYYVTLVLCSLALLHPIVLASFCIILFM